MDVAGLVRVNGRVARELGTTVGPGDVVEYGGRIVEPAHGPAYLVMNKPHGVMTTMRDPEGRRTAQQAVSNTLALLAVSLFPFVFKMAGTTYLAGAIVLGAGFLWCALQFSRQLTLARARQLFFASIIYLPLLLALMVWDKVK